MTLQIEGNGEGIFNFGRTVPTSRYVPQNPEKPMLDFASSSDVGDVGEAASPSASDTEILDAYSNAVTTVAEASVRRWCALRFSNDKGRPGGVGSGVIISPDGLVLTNSPCGRRRQRRRAAGRRGPRHGGARLGERPRHRSRAVCARVGARPAVRHAWRFKNAQARPARGRHRQSARL